MNISHSQEAPTSSTSDKPEKDFGRICASKLSKRELESLYYDLLHNNMELKKTVNKQGDKIKVLSTRLQRTSISQNRTMGKEKDCCAATKAVVKDQKDAIADLRRANDRLTERIKQLNMKLCSTKQFLKRPSQSSRCTKCFARPPSGKNGSTTGLDKRKSGDIELSTSSTSCQCFEKELKPLDIDIGKEKITEPELSKPVETEPNGNNKYFELRESKQPESERPSPVKGKENKKEPPPKTPGTNREPKAEKPLPASPPVLKPKENNNNKNKRETEPRKISEIKKEPKPPLPNESKPNDNKKEVPQKLCVENKCKTQMEELREKIANLQEELTKTHQEYADRIAKLEQEVIDLHSENLRVVSDCTTRTHSMEQREKEAQELAARLRDAEDKCGDLQLQLTIEKNKVAELETQVKAADVSNQVAKAVDGHFSRKDSKARDKPNGGVRHSNCVPPPPRTLPPAPARRSTLTRPPIIYSTKTNTQPTRTPPANVPAIELVTTLATEPVTALVTEPVTTRATEPVIARATEPVTARATEPVTVPATALANVPVTPHATELVTAIIPAAVTEPATTAAPTQSQQKPPEKSCCATSTDPGDEHLKVQPTAARFSTASTSPLRVSSPNDPTNKNSYIPTDSRPPASYSSTPYDTISSAQTLAQPASSAPRHASASSSAPSTRHVSTSSSPLQRHVSTSSASPSARHASISADLPSMRKETTMENEEQSYWGNEKPALIPEATISPKPANSPKNISKTRLSDEKETKSAAAQAENIEFATPKENSESSPSAQGTKDNKSKPTIGCECDEESVNEHPQKAKTKFLQRSKDSKDKPTKKAKTKFKRECTLESLNDSRKKRKSMVECQCGEEINDKDKVSNAPQPLKRREFNYPGSGGTPDSVLSNTNEDPRKMTENGTTSNYVPRLVTENPTASNDHFRQMSAVSAIKTSPSRRMTDNPKSSYAPGIMKENPSTSDDQRRMSEYGTSQYDASRKMTDDPTSSYETPRNMTESNQPDDIDPLNESNFRPKTSTPSYQKNNDDSGYAEQYKSGDPEEDNNSLAKVNEKLIDRIAYLQGQLDSLKVVNAATLPTVDLQVNNPVAPLINVDLNKMPTNELPPVNSVYNRDPDDPKKAATQPEVDPQMNNPVAPLGNIDWSNIPVNDLPPISSVYNRDSYDPKKISIISGEGKTSMQMCDVDNYKYPMRNPDSNPTLRRGVPDDLRGSKQEEPKGEVPFAEVDSQRMHDSQRMMDSLNDDFPKFIDPTDRTDYNRSISDYIKKSKMPVNENDYERIKKDYGPQRTWDDDNKSQPTSEANKRWGDYDFDKSDLALNRSDEKRSVQPTIDIPKVQSKKMDDSQNKYQIPGPLPVYDPRDSASIKADSKENNKERRASKDSAKSKGNSFEHRESMQIGFGKGNLKQDPAKESKGIKTSSFDSIKTNLTYDEREIITQDADKPGLDRKKSTLFEDFDSGQTDFTIEGKCYKGDPQTETKAVSDYKKELKETFETYRRSLMLEENPLGEVNLVPKLEWDVGTQEPPASTSKTNTEMESPLPSELLQQSLPSASTPIESKNSQEADPVEIDDSKEDNQLDICERFTHVCTCPHSARRDVAVFRSCSGTLRFRTTSASASKFRRCKCSEQPNMTDANVDADVTMVDSATQTSFEDLRTDRVIQAPDDTNTLKVDDKKTQDQNVQISQPQASVGCQKFPMQVVKQTSDFRLPASQRPDRNKQADQAVKSRISEPILKLQTDQRRQVQNQSQTARPEPGVDETFQTQGSEREQFYPDPKYQSDQQVQATQKHLMRQSVAGQILQDQALRSRSLQAVVPVIDKTVDAQPYVPLHHRPKPQTQQATQTCQPQISQPERTQTDAISQQTYKLPKSSMDLRASFGEVRRTPGCQVSKEIKGQSPITMPYMPSMDQSMERLRPIQSSSAKSQHAQTYTLRGSAEVMKCTRATSPDNTDHEISSMSDLPSEKCSTPYTSPRAAPAQLSPGEQKSSATATSTPTFMDSSTMPESLSEGEVPGDRGAKRSCSEKLSKESAPDPGGMEASSSQKMELALQAISEELARCRKLLLQNQRSQESSDQNPKTKDAASMAETYPSSIALRKTEGKASIGDAFTPKCIFTLHIGTVVLSDEAVISSRDMSLMLTWQFYDQNVTMTRMRAGRVIHFDFSTEYDVKLTDEFLDYLKHEEMSIIICELNKKDEPFASCSLPLRGALLHTNRRADLSLALVAGPRMLRARGATDALDTGDEMGVLDLWCMLRAEPRLLPYINRAIAKPPLVDTPSSVGRNSLGPVMMQVDEGDQDYRFSGDLDLDMAKKRKRSFRHSEDISDYMKGSLKQDRIRYGSHTSAPTVLPSNVGPYRPLVKDLGLSASINSSRAEEMPLPEYGTKGQVSFEDRDIMPRRESSGILINEVPANITSTSEMKKALEKTRTLEPLTRKPDDGGMRSPSVMSLSVAGRRASPRDKSLQRLSLSAYSQDANSFSEIQPDGTWKRSSSRPGYRSTEPVREDSDVTSLSKKFDSNKMLVTKKAIEAFKRVKIKPKQERDQYGAKLLPLEGERPAEYLDRIQTQSLDITILWLALNDECEAMTNPNVQRLYVAYSFLGRNGADLETPVSLPKPQQYQDKCYFDFKKTFKLKDGDLPRLGRLAKCRAPAKGRPNLKECVVFTVVSEPAEDPLALHNCEDIGYAYLYLGDLLAYSAGSDSYTEVLPVLAAQSDDVVCGVLAINMDGLDVVRKCLIQNKCHASNSNW